MIFDCWLCHSPLGGWHLSAYSVIPVAELGLVCVSLAWQELTFSPTLSSSSVRGAIFLDCLVALWLGRIQQLVIKSILVAHPLRYVSFVLAAPGFATALAIKEDGRLFRLWLCLHDGVCFVQVWVLHGLAISKEIYFLTQSFIFRSNLFVLADIVVFKIQLA